MVAAPFFCADCGAGLPLGALICTSCRSLRVASVEVIADAAGNDQWWADAFGKQPTLTVERPYRILSLGVGVQSSTVFLMSCEGELPKLDYAIFADPGWEPAEVYEYLGYLKEQGDKAGIPILTVSAGNIRQDQLRAYVRKEQYENVEGGRWANIPFYTRQANGDMGIIRRQCTKEYKIQPIEKAIREILGLKYRSPWPKTLCVEQWFGISAEEQRRVRFSEARWKSHHYPLIHDLSRPFRRHDCLLWLQEHGHPLPHRSACLGCPFHSDEEWRAIKANPMTWTDVTEFDAAIRKRGGMRGDLYLHRSGQPLVQIDFSTAEERGQGTLGFREECLGYCGT